MKVYRAGGGFHLPSLFIYVKGLKNVKGHLHEWRGICQNECVREHCVKGRGGVPFPSLFITLRQRD